MAVCDIIIPVYNGYQVLLDCLESVSLHTNQLHRVVVIDDASPDERIWPLLQRFAESAGFHVLQNPQNLGFVGTVNRGMALSDDRDVILLNSDTVVTAGWVEKMQECAYSHPKVGSVTPLSNNATICSVPDFITNNPLPDGYDVNSFAALVESSSLRQYPELPTAVGFCMLIRRDALRDVGFFDADAFPLGYGEECDWSMRALRRGWLNLCDDATYIYHQGSVSFSERDDVPVQGNAAELHRRHPEYADTTQAFMARNPLALIQNNLRSALSEGEWRPGLLYFLHGPVDQGIPGGTELHVRDLVTALGRRYRCYVAYVQHDCLWVDCFTPDGQGGLKKQAYAFPFAGEDDQYEDVLCALFSAFDIRLVHVQHVIKHPVEALFRALTTFRGPKLLTVHDYYPVCPRYNLLYKDQYYCGLTRNEFACASCIRATQGWALERLRDHRALFRDGLAQFDRLIFPSMCLRDDVLSYYSLDPGKADVIPHGLPSVAVPRRSEGFHAGEPLRIAFIGTLVNVKGVATLRRAVAENTRKNIEWHIWGVPDPAIASPKAGSVYYHGGYERGTIVRQLVEKNIHCGFLPSICPETYSFTLSEFYQAHIPVIGSNLGAIGERIERDQTGWTVSSNDVQSILQLIGEIMEAPERLAEVRARGSFHVPTLDVMSEAYLRHYEQLLASAAYLGK